VFELVLESLGKRPIRFHLDMPVSLHPEMTARTAMSAILQRLLQVIRINEGGIKEDRDPEHLHDFRVAVRRTRTGLTQIKYVFPEEYAVPFAGFFRGLAKASNELRDIDVFLHGCARYEAKLPEQARPQLKSLLELLRVERVRLQRDFVKKIDSPEYLKAVTDWDVILRSSSDLTSAAPKNAAERIAILANKAIRKTHDRVVQIIDHIDDSTPDKDIHMLRLQCKKLRYLLEIFTSLYPPDKIGLLIKQLKIVQDCLGEFCDLSIQLTRLRALSDPADRALGWNNELAAVTSELIATLRERQKEVRKNFSGTLGVFISQDDSEAYAELVRGG
jgi:CHAD domain-containing protein